ncbi:MAG: MFS transporter [Dehalococcoidia bacterium]|nr:MFS transporter [Dehalococcoidia bacterium]
MATSAGGNREWWYNGSIHVLFRHSVTPSALSRSRVYYGWWVAVAISFVSFSQVAFFNPVLGVFIAPLEAEFGWSRGVIAGALSLGTLAGALISPVIGPMLDRWGGRWFATGAMLALGACLLLLAGVNSVWQYYLLYGIGRAIVTSVVNLTLSVTISNWFIRSRGRANAVMLTGTRGGMALMPLIVLLFVAIADFRLAFAGLGVLVLIFGVAPAYLYVRRRPEDMGLLPDGDAAPPPSDEPLVIASDERWSVSEAVRTPAFWFLLAGTSQLMFVGGATNLSMAPHIEDNGLGRNTAVTMVTAWALFGIVGGFIGGELRQRVSVRWALPGTLVFTALGMVWLVLVSEVWMAFVFAAWHGTAFGAQLPLNQTAFPDYFGRWTVGAIRGITAPVQFGLNALGPLVASIAFDRTGSYDKAFLVFAVMLLVGAGLIALASPPRRKVAYS